MHRSADFGWKFCSFPSSHLKVQLHVLNLHGPWDHVRTFSLMSCDPNICCSLPVYVHSTIYLGSDTLCETFRKNVCAFTSYQIILKTEDIHFHL